MTDHVPLFGDYTLALLDREVFLPFFDRHWPTVFEDIVDYDPRDLLNETETAARERLRERLDAVVRLNVGIHHRGELIGWSTGLQDSSERYSMTNSAVFPEHRGKGVYTAMLPKLLEIVRAEGFQVVYSRHQTTNNAVLVPKLKAGFVITGLEISDAYGTLVQLSYFFDERRRRVLDYRVGRTHPDDEIRRMLSL